jgi:hypothetical protein
MPPPVKVLCRSLSCFVGEARQIAKYTVWPRHLDKKLYDGAVSPENDREEQPGDNLVAVQAMGGRQRVSLDGVYPLSRSFRGLTQEHGIS